MTTIQLDALRTLAVGLVHIQWGNAGLEWPTTSRAHPSWWVWIVLTPKGPLWESGSMVFPMKVRWDLWERVIVPFLEEPENAKQPNEQPRNLVELFTARLVTQFKAVGLLPSDLVEAPEFPSVPQVLPSLEPEGILFVQFDSEDRIPEFEQFDEED